MFYKSAGDAFRGLQRFIIVPLTLHYIMTSYFNAAKLQNMRPGCVVNEALRQRQTSNNGLVNNCRQRLAR